MILFELEIFFISLSRENRALGVIFLQKIPHRIFHVAEAIHEARVRKQDLRFEVLLARKAAAAQGQKVFAEHRIAL